MNTHSSTQQTQSFFKKPCIKNICASEQFNGHFDLEANKQRQSPKSNNPFQGTCALSFDSIQDYVHYIKNLPYCLNPFLNLTCKCKGVNACPMLVNLNTILIKPDRALKNFLGLLIPQDCTSVRKIVIVDDQFVYLPAKVKIPIYEFFIILPTCFNQQEQTQDIKHQSAKQPTQKFPCKEDNPICIRSIHKKTYLRFLSIHTNIDLNAFSCNGTCFIDFQGHQICFGQTQYNQQHYVSSHFDFLNKFISDFKFQNIVSSQKIQSTHAHILTYAQKYFSIYKHSLNEFERIHLAFKNFHLLSFFIDKNCINSFFSFYLDKMHGCKLKIKQCGKSAQKSFDVFHSSILKKIADPQNAQFKKPLDYSSLHLISHFFGFEFTLDHKQFVSLLQTNYPLFFVLLKEKQFIVPKLIEELFKHEAKLLTILKGNQIIEEVMSRENLLPNYALGVALHRDSIRIFYKDNIEKCCIDPLTLFEVADKITNLHFPGITLKTFRAQHFQQEIAYFAEEPYEFESIDELVDQFVYDPLLVLGNKQVIPLNQLDHSIIAMLKENNLDTIVLKSQVVLSLSKNKTPKVYELCKNNENICSQLQTLRHAQPLQYFSPCEAKKHFFIQMGKCCTKEEKLPCKNQRFCNLFKQNRCKFCHCSTPQLKEYLFKLE